MAEKYTPNLAFQPYIAPQQELPVAEFDALGKTLNDRYDKNIAKWDELDAYINQVQLSNADQSIKDSVVKDTRDTLKSIRENGNWENGKMQVREVAKRLANDQALAVGQKRFQAMQKQKEVESQMRMQGHTLIDFKEDRFDIPTIDPITGRINNSMDFSGAEKLQDYDARRKSIFEGVTADGNSWENSSPSPDRNTGAVYQVGSAGNYRYIDKKKITDIANRNLGNYIDSAEGQQEMKMLTTKNSMNVNPLSYADAKKAILNDLINTGLTRTFKDGGSKNVKQMVSSGSGENSNPPSDNIEQIPLNLNNKNQTFADLTKKIESGNQTEIDYKNSRAVTTSTLPNLMSADRSVTTSQAERLSHLTPKENKILNNVALMLGITKNNGGYKVSELKRIGEYMKKTQTNASSPVYKAFTKEEISQNKNYVDNANLASAGFYDITEDKFVEYNKLKDDIMGAKTDDIKYSGNINSDNHFYDLAVASKREKNPDGWVRPRYITIKGKPYAVTSSLTETRKADTQFQKQVNKISSSNRYGTPVEYKTQAGEKLISYPNGGLSSSGQPLYDVKDSQGKIIATLPLNNLADKVNRKELDIIE